MQLIYYLIYVTVEIGAARNTHVVSKRCTIKASQEEGYLYSQASCRCFDARDLALNRHKEQKPPWTIKFLSNHCIKLPKVRRCKSIFCSSGLLQANSETLGQKGQVSCS